MNTTLILQTSVLQQNILNSPSSALTCMIEYTTTPLIIRLSTLFIVVVSGELGNKSSLMPQLEQLYNSIIEAQARIQDDIVKTPLIFSQQFSDQFHCSLHLKLEHHQRTGSFKLRGAHSKLSLLSQDTDHQKTIVTASTGNHGLACLDAMSRYKMSGRIVVPDTVSQCKREKLTSLGADLVYHGTDCEETETAARAMASDSVEYVSPYNDLDIVSGTGCGYRISPIFPPLKISCLQSINLLPKP